jgi:putative ABC transport system permease protein
VYDAIVTRENTSDRKTRHLLDQAPGVEAFYSELVLEAKTQEEQTFRVRALEGDLTAFPFKLVKGRLFSPNTYEATAGYGFLDWLGLEVGDEITITFEDQENRPIKLQIVGEYPERAEAGQMLMMSLPTVARLVKMEPTAYFLKLSPYADSDLLERYLQPRADSDLNVRFIGQKMPDDILYLQIAIFAFSVILIVIALINVFNTSLLTVRERVRTIGVLKAVGMTSLQVVTMVNVTAGFLGCLAALIGFPLGLILAQKGLALLSKNYGLSGVNASLSPLYILALVPLIAGSSVFGSTIPGRWAAKLSVVKVLRRE